MKVIRNKSSDETFQLPSDTSEKLARQFWFFCMLVHKGDLAEAASALKSKPNSVLAEIKKLEVALSQTLLETRSPSLYVTPIGESVFQQTSPALVAVENGIAGAFAAVLKNRIRLMFGLKPKT